MVSINTAKRSWNLYKPFAPCRLSCLVSHLAVFVYAPGGSVLEWIDPYDSTVYCIKSAGGHCIVSGTSHHGVVRLWDKRHSDPVRLYYTPRTSNKHSSPVYSLAFDLRHLYVALDLGIYVLDFSVYSWLRHLYVALDLGIYVLDFSVYSWFTEYSKAVLWYLSCDLPVLRLSLVDTCHVISQCFVFYWLLLAFSNLWFCACIAEHSVYVTTTPRVCIAYQHVAMLERTYCTEWCYIYVWHFCYMLRFCNDISWLLSAQCPGLAW